jgi:hypothetical protein
MSTFTQTAPSATKADWTGRIISTLLVVFFLFDGAMKFVKPEHVVKGSAEFGIPAEALNGIGAALLVSTVLYAIPSTAVLGAILLTGYLGGAIMTHVRVGGLDFLFAAFFGVLVWLGIYLREPRLRALIPVRQPAA